MNIPDMFVQTSGVSALPLSLQFSLWGKVASFSSFSYDNDPHGEHDFGAFEAEGAGMVFWKLDCYADGR